MPQASRLDEVFPHFLPRKLRADARRLRQYVPPVTDSRPVIPRRSYKDFPRYEHRIPYDATVVVVRDRNPFGNPAKANVRVDGDAMAGLGSAERVTFYVSPGDHCLSVEPAFHIGPTPVGRTFHFEPDQTSYFRVVTSVNSFDLQPARTAR